MTQVAQMYVGIVAIISVDNDQKLNYKCNHRISITNCHNSNQIQPYK